MNSEDLVSRPQYDSRAVAHRLQKKSPALEQEVPQLSSGSATAGFRSAKYTPEEWFSNNRPILEKAGTDRHQAQNVQTESRTLNQNTEATTMRTQIDGTRLLGERLQGVHYWMSELKRHIEQLQADTESLQAARKRLEKALNATEIAYFLSTDNLSCRARRPGPDLVKDAVEEELLKEVDLIRSIQALLKKTTAQVITQIKANREAQQTLEMDWSDKFQTYGFDDRSGRHSNTSPDTQLHPSSATMQEQICTPSTWAKFTQDNLSKAMQEEQASNSLRRLVEQMLQDTTDDLTDQFSIVDRAFSQRCEEVTKAKTELERSLAQNLEEIGAQEKNIVALQQSINNKEAPLRVVQSRLYLRSLRPNMELCRDLAQLSLEGEAKQLDAIRESLTQKLSEARSSLSHLEDSRMALVKAIDCKSQSLFIDREKCMSQRKRYPTISVLKGY